MFYDQDRLRIISDLIVDDLEAIFAYFEVKDIKKGNTKYYGACPVHRGGADKSPFNLFTDGDYYKGNWKCRSHGCEQTFKKSILGLIRGLLSAKSGWNEDNNKIVSFNETVKWCEEWTGQSLSGIKVDKILVEKNRFISQKWAADNKVEGLRIKRADIQKMLKIASPYFLERGYNKSILEHFSVGDCISQGKPMSERAVVPVFDATGDIMIGCTGRSIYDKCEKCSLWHNPKTRCPSTDLEKYFAVKWRHNSGFETRFHLYNNTKTTHKAIEDTLSIVLVESPGNCWRLLESGVNQVLACFGSSLDDAQQEIITKTPALVINVASDNDKGGDSLYNIVSKKLKYTHQVNRIIVPPEFNDISDMSNEQVKEIIIPQIRTYKL